jgi:nicotinamidase/pyrazinamidase
MNERITFQEGDALLLIDVQKDFCPGGALPVEDGHQILPEANAWLAQARLQHIPVYASRDWHPQGHVSFAEEGGPWPKHCLQDSDGAQFHPDLRLPPDTVVVTKGVRFDRDQTSVFDETGLAPHLKDRGIRRLLVGGLALEACVRDSIMDAVAAGFEVVLITEATLPVDAAAVPHVLERLRAAGVAFTDKDVLVERAAAPDSRGTPPDVCVKAPEWAEHQRLDDPDLPCDDGRSGRI